MTIVEAASFGCVTLHHNAGIGAVTDFLDVGYGRDVDVGGDETQRSIAVDMNAPVSTIVAALVDTHFASSTGGDDDDKEIACLNGNVVDPDAACTPMLTNVASDARACALAYTETEFALEIEKHVQSVCGHVCT
jgi:hypothetical protein